MKLTAATCWLLPFILLLGGCASGPRFENKQQLDDASIRCEQLGFGAALTGESMVSINEIDGSKTAVMRKGAVYYVRPGHHELEVTFGRMNTRQMMHHYVQFEAIASHEYVLKAYKKGDNFYLEVIDETDPKATSVVATEKVKASLPILLPIPIP